MTAATLSLVTATSATRMNPACAIDEYASTRLKSVWVIPKTAPTTIDAIATAQMIGRQSQRTPAKPTYKTRSSAPNEATFVHEAMNAATGVAEPEYTSGVQLWNGATLALNSSPTSSSASPA